jgi:hypothetical protein
MNAVLDIIADGRRAIVVIDREAVEINIFSFSLLILIKPFDGDLGQPLPERLPGVGYARPTKPCRWRGKRLHHGGEFVCLCFASQKPSKREFFVPAGVDLGVKLLTSYFPKEYFSYINVCRIRQYHSINDKYNKVILIYIILSQEVFFLHLCVLKISAGFLIEVQLSVHTFYKQMYECHYQCSHKKVDFLCAENQCRIPC